MDGFLCGPIGHAAYRKAPHHWLGRQGQHHGNGRRRRCGGPKDSDE